MRGVTLVAFAGSLVLAAGFFFWKLMGPDVRYPIPVAWVGEWLLPVAYILGLVGLVAGALSRRIDEGAFAIIGGLVGAAAVVFSVLQFLHEQQRSVDRATLQLLVDMDVHRPPNARFCRCAVYKLLTDTDRTPLDNLFKRVEVPLNSKVRGMVEKCFSDLNADERKELMPDGLTPRGASVFASRVNRILNFDDNVAFAIHYGVVRKENVSEATTQSTAVAKLIAKTYEDRLGFKGFANLQRLDVPKLPKEVCEDDRGIAAP